MASATPRIAIIGAGPAGSMLARLLHQAGITSTIFEGEDSPNFRSQGGSLDLHTSTGLAAIKQAGLWTEFLEKARFESDFLQLADKDLNIVFRKAGAPAPKADGAKKENSLNDQRPEIDRSELRRLLVESVPEGTIRWGHHLERVEAGGTLVFRDGTTETGFDLVVGADGAWSKVRALLSDVKPSFAGVGYHELSLQDPEHTAPELYAAVRGGNLFAYAEGRKLTAQQMGDGSFHISINLATEDAEWAAHCGYDPSNLDETKKAYLDGPFADWHPTLRQAIARAGPRCIGRSLWHLPVGFRWAHQRGATLVGDAAHLMTPYAGEGVNVALEDAMKLAQGIVDAVGKHPAGGAAQRDALDAAVAAYEDDMFPRTKKVTKLTAELLRLWMHTPGTPQAVIPDVMSEHVRYHAPAVAYPFVSLAMRSYIYLLRLAKGPDTTIEV